MLLLSSSRDKSPTILDGTKRQQYCTARNDQQKATLPIPEKMNALASPWASHATTPPPPPALPLRQISRLLLFEVSPFTYSIVDNNAYRILDSGNVVIDCLFRSPNGLLLAKSVEGFWDNSILPRWQKKWAKRHPWI